jgi:hypothetical protein
VSGLSILPSDWETNLRSSLRVTLPALSFFYANLSCHILSLQDELLPGLCSSFTLLCLCQITYAYISCRYYIVRATFFEQCHSFSPFIIHEKSLKSVSIMMDLKVTLDGQKHCATIDIPQHFWPSSVSIECYAIYWIVCRQYCAVCAQLPSVYRTVSASPAQKIVVDWDVALTNFRAAILFTAAK